jgi:hypothetical protein
MSPDDPEYEALVEPPMRGWELHPPNMNLGLPGQITRTVEKTYSVACSVLTPHFEEIDTSLMVEKEKLRIECAIKHPAVNGPSQATRCLSTSTKTRMNILGEEHIHTIRLHRIRTGSMHTARICTTRLSGVP